MDAAPFASQVHPVSGRGAVLEEEDGVAYLYLMLSASGGIIGHVLAYRGAGDGLCGFRWADNGCSVALLDRGRPLAFILDGEALGYSRNITADDASGCSWDEAKYASVFLDV